jgi:tetratricopeptide (TPR) repeat protein
VLLQQQGEPQAALPLLERSLGIWRDLGDRDQQVRELNSLGVTHKHLGDPDTARSLLEESAAISREVGSDFRLAAALTNLGQLEADAGNFDRATQVLQEALAIDTKQGDMFGEGLRAARLAGAAEAIRRKTGIPIKQPETLEEFLARARAALAPEQWNAALAAGRALSQQQAATLLVSPALPHDTLQ